MSVVDTFVERVEAGTADHPFRVERTDRGFRVVLDVVDAQWWGLLSRSGLRQTYVYDVRVDEPASTFAITDRAARIDWTAGANSQPRLAVSAQAGRVVTRQRTVVIGGTDRGTVEPVVDVRFDSEAQRRLIRDVGRELGLRERWGVAQRIGLWAAIGGGVAAVFGAVVAVLAVVGT